MKKSRNFNKQITKEKIASMIDHTYLKQDTNSEIVIKICKEAIEYKFASVCIPPCYVKLAKKQLKNSDVKVCTVIGFPLGYNINKIKILETKDAIKNGADEIDMVMNIGKLKSGDIKYVKKEIKHIIKAARGRVVKVIIETALLTDSEKEIVCKLVEKVNANFLKTSTGFSSSGATAKDILLLRKISPKIKIKASGGIKTLNDVLTMIKAGASRIGTSSSIQIINGK